MLYVGKCSFSFTSREALLGKLSASVHVVQYSFLEYASSPPLASFSCGSSWSTGTSTPPFSPAFINHFLDRQLARLWIRKNAFTLLSLFPSLWSNNEFHLALWKSSLKLFLQDQRSAINFRVLLYSTFSWWWKFKIRPDFSIARERGAHERKRPNIIY